MFNEYVIDVLVVVLALGIVFYCYTLYVKARLPTTDYRKLQREYPYVSQWLCSVVHQIRTTSSPLPYPRNLEFTTPKHQVYHIGRFEFVVFYQYDTVRLVVVRDKTVVLDYFHSIDHPVFVSMDKPLELNQFDYDLKALVPPSTPDGIWINPQTAEDCN